MTSTGKLISQLHELQNLYPRVCGSKGKEEGMVSEILLLIGQWNTCSSSLPRSKPSHYKETAVSRLLSTGVHVLFSQLQSHSASLLATLGSSEAVRGHTISLTEQHIQTVQPAVMKLLQCVPNAIPHCTQHGHCLYVTEGTLTLVKI